MRVSKVLGTVVAVAVALVGLTATSESTADDANLAKLTCAGGNVTVTSGDAAYHLNIEAPWKWDKGTKVSLSEAQAKFHGDACTGTVSAYLCNNDKSNCKSVKVAVK